MNNQERKLCSIRNVAEIKPIEGADLIEAVRVDGWWVVAKKGEFAVGQPAQYFEIDSFIPIAIAPFLSKGKEPKKFNGVAGERLRTVKLKGQLSQGLLLPVINQAGSHFVTRCDGAIREVSEGDDLTDFYGVQKWELPIDAKLAGLIRGHFPSFIPKTDQPRIQNLSKDWDNLCTLSYEVTEKLDGSSMTVYVKDDVNGVCSRNLDLKEDCTNSFWFVALRDKMHDAIRSVGVNLAIQGELVGPGIQGNSYKLSEFRFYCFDIFDIDKQEYLLPNDRQRICFSLGLNHVPVVKSGVNLTLATETLAFAEGKSFLNPDTDREGFVYKSMSDSTSFKCISDAWLLKN